MRIGSGTAAVIALALIAAGDVHGAGLGSDQAGKPTWPWRLTQQAEPSTPPAQPAAPLEQPAQEKAQENRPSGAPSPPAANAPPAAPPAGTPAVVLDDQEVSGIVGKSVRSSADEDMGRIVDVIVSHDCPRGVDIPGVGPDTKGGARGDWPSEILAEAQRHRDKLATICRATAPGWLFHGHYHIPYAAKLDATQVVGLADDRAAMEDHTLVLDPDDL